MEPREFGDVRITEASANDAGASRQAEVVVQKQIPCADRGHAPGGVHVFGRGRSMQRRAPLQLAIGAHGGLPMRRRNRQGLSIRRTQAVAWMAQGNMYDVRAKPGAFPHLALRRDALRRAVPVAVEEAGDPNIRHAGGAHDAGEFRLAVNDLARSGQMERPRLRRSESRRHERTPRPEHVISPGRSCPRTSNRCPTSRSCAPRRAACTPGDRRTD